MVLTGTPIMFGPMPMAMTCPHCQAQIVTSTSYEPGTLTWLLCGGIALVG
jgi:lipopolysaccharide-induced tumor necrosis factor-alpha factor